MGADLTEEMTKYKDQIISFSSDIETYKTIYGKNNAFNGYINVISGISRVATLRGTKDGGPVK
jgi:hypothetical protein